MKSRGTLNLGILICVLITSCNAASSISDREIDDAVARLRPVLTEVEMDDFIEACLAENAVVSFERSPGGNGFFGSGITERDQAVMEECQSSLFEQHPNPPTPSTEAEFMVLYRLYVEQSACLESLGLEVRLPSFEAYRDGNGDWFPFRDLPEPTSAAEWTHWNEECPQSPWSYDSVVNSE